MAYPLPRPGHSSVGSGMAADPLAGSVDAWFATEAARGKPRSRAVAYARVKEFSSMAGALNSVPPEGSSAPKTRVMILSSSMDGIWHIHKARVNADGSVQVGRTWDLGELNKIQVISTNPRVLAVVFQREYFWRFSDPGTLRSFVGQLRRAYEPYTGSALKVFEGPPTAAPVPESIAETVAPLRTNSVRASPPAPPAHGPGAHGTSAHGPAPPAHGYRSSPHPQVQPQPQPQPQQPHGQPGLYPLHTQQQTQAPNQSGYPLGREGSFGSESRFTRHPSAAGSISSSIGSPVESRGHLPALPDDDSPPPAIPAPSRLRSIRSAQRPPGAAHAAAHAGEHVARPASRNLPVPPTEPRPLPTPRGREAEIAALAEAQALAQRQAEQAREARERELQERELQERELRERELRERELRERELRERELRERELRERELQQKEAQAEQERIARAHAEEAAMAAKAEEEARKQAAHAEERDRQRRLQAEREEAELQARLEAKARDRAAREQQQKAEAEAKAQEEARAEAEAEIRVRSLARDAERSTTLGLVDGDDDLNEMLPPVPSDGGVMGDSPMADLAAVINEFQWTGDDVQALELQINEKISQLHIDNVSDVIALDDSLDKLDTLLTQGIAECTRLDGMMSSIAVQLASIGDDIKQIEGSGDGVQVVSANRRALYQELRELLSTFNKPEKVMIRIDSTKLDDMHALPELEEAVGELYRAIRMSTVESGDGMGDMRALESRKGEIAHMTASFSQKFGQFFVRKLKQLPEPPESGDGDLGVVGRLDGVVLRHMYIYSALVLFVKEADPTVYTSLISAYTKWAKGFYDERSSLFFAKWKRSFESVVGQRPPMAFQQSQHHYSTSGSAIHNMQSMALRKTKSTIRSNDSRPHPSGPDDSAASDGSGSSKPTAVKFALPDSKQQKVYRLMREVVELLCLHIPSQLQVLTLLFHMTSTGYTQYDTFIRRVPVDKRAVKNLDGDPMIQSVDPSRAVALQLYKAQSKIFGQLQDQIMDVSKVLKDSAILESIYLVAVLEQRIRTYRSANQEFLYTSLEALRTQLLQQWTAHSESQTRAILGSRFSTKKRVGVFPVVSRFTEYVSICEKSFEAASRNGEPAENTRKALDTSYETLFRAIMQGFRQSESQSQALATSTQSRANIATTAAEENKEVLNRHVILIENTNAMFSEMEQFGSSDSMQTIVLQSKQTYRKELELYIGDVIHRPLGKIIDYVLQHEKPNPGNPKLQKQKHRIAAVKRAVAGYDAKELRKGVETLRKRVEKHFGDGGAIDASLIDKVWKAIGAQYLDYYNRLVALARECDSESVIEFSRQDVQNAFR